MQLTIHVPVCRTNCHPEKPGMLEAIALGAVLGFLMTLGDSGIANTKTTSL
jgi:hypothetical protein